MTMDEIVEHDKAETRKDNATFPSSGNPKKAIEEMVKKSKTRQDRQIIEDEALYAESTIKKSTRSNKSAVKTKTTLKLGKEQAEITTTTKKVVDKRSASAKKLSASARKLLAKAPRQNSAKKGKVAKTAPPGSRKQSAVKAVQSARSMMSKRVGAKSPSKP